MSGTAGAKALLGYDIIAGVGVEEYETWLADVHFPDLLANPHLDRLVLNDIVRPITTTSAGTPSTGEPTSFYRIVELHFADLAAYERYLEWFVEHPIPEERSPAGRTDFGFYVLASSAVVDRDRRHRAPAP